MFSLKIWDIIRVGVLIKRGFCCCCCCTLLSVAVSVALVRTVRVCTLCIFDSVVCCTLLLVFVLMINEGWYRLVKRIWSEHTASRIKTKRGQYTFPGSELFNNQPQTLSDDDGFVVLGCYMDSTVSRRGRTTKPGHFTCSKRIDKRKGPLVFTVCSW